MDDTDLRKLARRAGDGDLDAARQLVRWLLRIGAQSQEEALIKQAIETLAIARKGNYSGDHDHLLELGDQAYNLAKNVITLLGDVSKFEENAFGVQEIIFQNGNKIQIDNDGMINE